MKLLLISASLHKGGFTYKVTEYEAVEKPSTYFIEGGKKRISKAEIMHFCTNIRENHRHLQLHTYCLEHQREKVIRLLKAGITEQLTGMVNELAEVLTASQMEFTERA